MRVEPTAFWVTSSLRLLLFQGLSLKLNAGIDRTSLFRGTYEPKTTLWGHNTNGNADVYNNDNNQYLLEATASYTRTFKDIHKLLLLAGTSYEQFEFKNSRAGNNDFLTDALAIIPRCWSRTKRVGSGYSKNNMESYFFRANYILKDRYYLTATMRADGASVFAKNHKWGYFPSVALGWTMSEEPFMKDLIG